MRTIGSFIRNWWLAILLVLLVLVWPVGLATGWGWGWFPQGRMWVKDLFTPDTPVVEIPDSGETVGAGLTEQQVAEIAERVADERIEASESGLSQDEIDQIVEQVIASMPDTEGLTNEQVEAIIDARVADAIGEAMAQGYEQPDPDEGDANGDDDDGNGNGNSGTGADFGGFVPDWSGLSQDCPSTSEVLSAHGITSDMLEGDVVVSHPQVSWNPCIVVIELDAEHEGSTTIPLLVGYQYTADTVSDGVQIFWGGDEEVTEVTLLHGTSFRWGPSYPDSESGWWLDPNDPDELACREHRFGRYRRNDDSGLRDVPYFGRVGPYYTGMGNLNVDWIPPGLDEIVPHNFMDACAMLGGRAVESEWQNSADFLNWAWKYTNKVAGSADYCPPGDPCWQTVYIPAGPGFVELWVDGPKKFFAEDWATLLDGFHNVDEFSYHADPNK